MNHIFEIDIDKLLENQEIKEADEKNENDYLTLANDCRNRIQIKNEKIGELQKKIICLYAFIRRFMETEEPAFIEEARLMLDECLIDNIGIQTKD